MVTRSILRPVLRPVTRAVSDTIRGFNPRSLFSAGEQGIWLDPSDFSTLFQDAAGTTPVTAVGQPVGLALDKRLGLALSANDFPVSTSTLTGWIAGANLTSVSSNGTGITFTGGGDINFSGSNWLRSTTTHLTRYAFYEVRLKARHLSGGGTLQVGLAFNKIKEIASASNGGVLTEYVFRGFADATPWSNYLSIAATAAGSTWYIEDVKTYPIFGNHAYQTTSASRPTLQQDSNGLYYLSFDGTDDGMATPSINFTGTDKMTVWAGVRKLSDAAAAIICELSATSGTNNGVFYLAGPATVAANYSFLSKGTTFGLAQTGAVFASPNSSVLTGIGSISGDSAILRVNGVQAAAGASDQGTGNYGNYPLYIGRRGGTTIPFNGRIYQLIVRGAESNAGQIAATEAYVNAKARAY